MISKEEFLFGLTVNEMKSIDFIKDLFQERHPKSILQIGSGNGISARALLEFSDAKISTIDRQRDLIDFDVRTDGLRDRVVRYIGEPGFILTTLEEKFDLIYVDGALLVKHNVSIFWDHLNVGGAVVLDDTCFGNGVALYENR